MDVLHSSSPPTGDSASNRFAIWFALLGGAIAWTLHLMLAYAVAEFGCLSGLGDTHLAGLTVVTWMLFGVTVVAGGIAALAILVSLRLHRRFRHVTASGEGARANAFSARLGLISNIVFALVIAVQAIPIFYFLRVC
jgi:hypothetical protein